MMQNTHSIFRPLIAVATLIAMFALPLVGAMARAEHSLAYYFQFPPEIVKSYPRFSWPGIALILVLPLLYLLFILFPRLYGIRQVPFTPAPPQGKFPLWGWIGLFLIALFWLISWTPIDAIAFIRGHAFTPLWIGYILTMDGVVYRIKGHSLLSRNSKKFLALFPASAVLWWLFEYVNRFVQNWYYVGGTRESSTLEYILYATPCFATVLPALLETAEWLGTKAWIHRRYAKGYRWKNIHQWSYALSLLGVLGLVAMGYAPTYFFPFAWLGPLLILIPLIHYWKPHHSILTHIIHGDYRALVALSLCGPVCGFFWEMWNFYSLAKWQYQVPFVMFGKIFEMPALGYFGYVPFGWECLVLWHLWTVIFGIDKDRIEIVHPIEDYS